MDNAKKILVLLGSPRKKGNSTTLANQIVKGAESAGAEVETIYLNGLKIRPCQGCYACKKEGSKGCVVDDDMQSLYPKIVASDALVIATPVYWFNMTAQTKIFMDRCQSLWVKKYWIENLAPGGCKASRRGLFISVGATRGKKLFDGTLLSVKYFFDVLDMSLWKALLYRGLDFEGDVQKHPEYMQEAYDAGKAFAEAVGELKG